MISYNPSRILYHKLRYGAVALLYLVFASPAAAQTDTLFWFAAPEVTQNPNNYDRPIILRITSYVQAATVTVTQPAGGGMPVQTLTVPANSTQSIDLTNWIDVIENKPANTVLNYGLKITSTAPVSIYYDIVSGGGAVRQLNPEVFVLKGKNALGTGFWIPSQNFIDNSTNPVHQPPPFSSFDIVATEDNTTVTITPSANITGHAAGIPFSILLNEGQTYSATAATNAAAGHLQGSRVVSDKPVAITVKDDLLIGPVYGTCGDLIGDQIIPAELLGTEYIAMNGLLNAPGDQLFITATRNGTTVSQDGILMATLNEGQTHRLPVGGASTYIQASEPVYVWQLSGIACEYGGGILPNIICTGSSSVSYIRTKNLELYLNLLVKSGSQGDFLINGAAGVVTAAQFAPVPGTGGQWYAAQVSLPLATYPQGSIVSVVNTSGLFHLGILEGGPPDGTSYGYFSDFGQLRVTAAASSTSICTGETIELLADTVVSATYAWQGPAGFNSTLQNPTVPGAAPSNSGNYILSINANGCSASDTITVSVFDRPVVSLGNDTALCADTLILQPADSYTDPSYRWSTGATDSLLPVTQSDIYWLEVTRDGCTGSDTIQVTFNPLLLPDLGPDIGVCDHDTSVILRAPQPSGTRYLWSNGLSDTLMVVNQSGIYWVQVELNGCTGSDTIAVRVIPAPVVDIGPDTVICEQFPLEIGTAVAGALYAWNTGATTPFISVDTTGEYHLEVSLAGCLVSDTVRITAMPPPDIDLGSDRDICPEQTILLDAAYGSNSIYLWSTGDTTAVYAATSGGTYWVWVQSEYQCIGSDTILLTHYPKPSISLGADTTVCEETPLRLIPWQINADSLLWSDGSTGNNLSVIHGGEYIVMGINKCGSTADTIQVKNIFCDIRVPNAFTPNGDGVNDVFRVIGNTGRLEGFELSIFNRWGERIFHTKDKHQGWDGNHKGKASALGTYVYMLEYSIAGRPYLQKGNFHLIR